MNLNFPTILLDTQRRMHPKIAEFPNQYFYENKLKTEYNHNFELEPIQIFDVNGKEKLDGTSFYNMEEVEEIIKIYYNLLNEFSDIVIISPYNAQCSKLKNKDNSLNVHTVDSFQGKEADIIILTTVRSNDDVGFWNDPRRLNVGLTRARHGLRIVGHLKTWDKKSGPLKDYLNYIKLNNITIK